MVSVVSNIVRVLLRFLYIVAGIITFRGLCRTAIFVREGEGMPRFKAVCLLAGPSPHAHVFLYFVVCGLVLGYVSRWAGNLQHLFRTQAECYCSESCCLRVGVRLFVHMVEDVSRGVSLADTNWCGCLCRPVCRIFTSV